MPHSGRRHARAPHGPARTSKKQADFRTLTAADLDRMTRRQLNRIARQVRKTQPYYLNARAQKGLGDGAPRYIFSDFRFKDYGFPVSWIAPRPKGFAVVKKGYIRKAQFIAFHCFGETYDSFYLRRNRGLVSVPTDINGHNPTRFLASMWYLTLWTLGKGAAVSIHFGVSRRGDFVSSVDLNDIAWATGGAVKLGFRMNFHSVGFELESHLARHIYRSTKRTRRIYRQPYSQKQLMCLAVALRKYHSWRPVVKIEWRSTPGEIIAAKKANAGGCIQHKTIAPTSRTDPGAQFNIPKGTRADFGSSMWNGTGTGRSGPGPSMESGWDQLDRMFQKIRAVNPATEAFQVPLTTSAIALAKASEVVNLGAHIGQRTAARVGRNRLAAMSRSESMQAQSRRALYAKAAAGNASLATLVSNANAVTSSIIRRMDLSAVVGVNGAVMFDESTGLWEDGDA